MTETPPNRLDQRAEQLKERVYITFTALTVTITLRSEGTGVTAGGAATTLVLTVLGTLLAVLLADVIAHIAVHAALPRGDALRQMLRVSLGSVGVVAVPLVLIGLSALKAISLAAALSATSIVLLATLIVVGYLAVRRLRLPLHQRLLVLLAEALLGAVVLALETAAH